MIQFSVSQCGLFLAVYTQKQGNPMIGQAFSVCHRRIFGLPMEEYFYIMFIIKTFSLFKKAVKGKQLRGRLSCATIP
jgi:hypothetical protein